MEKNYAVVEVCSEGVNPQVYIFENKEKARESLKSLWNKEVEALKKDCYKFNKTETWCDEEGDCARITYAKNDWTYYQVVDVQEGYDG